MEKSIESSSPLYKLLEEKSPIDQSPVFIVGFPRSGTTLLQSLVSTQGFITFPETHFFDHILQNLKQKNDHFTESSDQICQVIEEVLPMSDQAKTFIAHLEERTISTQTLFEILIMDNMLSQTKTDDLKTKRWLEKTPAHALYIDQISQYYPNAKFIFIMRNPLNSFASWRTVSQKWGDERVPVERYCEMWISHLESAEVFQKKHPSSILFVKLEDLVDDTPGGMKKIGTFLNIDLDLDKLEDRHETTNQIILPSETWKKDISRTISKDISERKNKDILTLFEHYRITKRLTNQLLKYHYNIKTIEPVDTDVFSFKSVISDLSSLEKIIKIQEEQKDSILKEHEKLYDIIKQKDAVIKERGKLYDIIKQKDAVIKERGKLYDVLSQKDGELKIKQQIISEYKQIFNKLYKTSTAKKIWERVKVFHIIKEIRKKYE